MSDIRRRRYNMFLRVRTFGADNAADFPNGSAGKRNFDQLNQAIALMEEGATGQASQLTRQATSNKASSRAELRERLSAISRTAKALAVDDETIDRLFQTSQTRNDQTLLAAARSFVTNATPLQAKFTDFGMPDTFLTDLQTAITNFEQAFAEQGQALNTSVGATAKADEGMEKGMDAIRRLRAIAYNKYADNPAKLAEWTSASHIEQPAAKKETEGENPTPS